MKRLILATSTALTLAKLARLLVMSPRPDQRAAWDRHVDQAIARVDLVKWEQHVDEAMALCDPAGDVIDNDVAFVMAVVKHGFAATLADIDELPEVRHG